MQPSASRPAELQRYTLTVPNERNVPTIAVRLAVPDGIDFFLVEKKPGWKAHIQRRNGRVVGVLFDGGTISPNFYDSFRFIAKNPVREGTIAWDVEQSYAGGEVVNWTGPPGSDTPAARTTITEAVVPIDVVDVANGRSGAAPVTVAGAKSRSGDTVPALVLSVIAIGLALVALGIPLLKGRPIV